MWLRTAELSPGPVGDALGEVMADLARDEARLVAWLDEQALRALYQTIGHGDLAAMQRHVDASARALLHRAEEGVGPAARATLVAGLANRGYFPMSPLGLVFVTHLESIVSDTARGKRPAHWARKTGLVARAIYSLTGTLRLSPPAPLDGRPGVPPPDVLAALQRALRDDAKLWKRWCNLCVMHSAWAGGLMACLRAASARLAEPEREAVTRWLAEPEWFATRGAISGSTTLEAYALTKVELVIEQR